MTTTYVAMYADEIGISVNSGLYFHLYGDRTRDFRLFSGRQVDKGRITLVITLGMYLACASFFALASLDALMKWNPTFTSLFYIAIALSQGVAFGTMFPAFNTLFVNLAPNSQRGTATSTYLTSWDVGIRNRINDRRKYRTGIRRIQPRLSVWSLPDSFIHFLFYLQGWTTFQQEQTAVKNGLSCQRFYIITDVFDSFFTFNLLTEHRRILFLYSGLLIKSPIFCSSSLSDTFAIFTLSGPTPSTWTRYPPIKADPEVKE